MRLRWARLGPARAAPLYLAGMGLTASALALAGCAVDAKRQASSDNAKLDVGVLGTAEGCTIYRFTDNGAFHYFVRCESGQASAGGAITRHDRTGEVPTLTGGR